LNLALTLGCYRDCAAIKRANSLAKSGYYMIAPKNVAVNTYCNMDIDGGGWTQIASLVTPLITTGITGPYTISETPAGLNWTELLILDGGSQFCLLWNLDGYCTLSGYQYG
jgi:hypothetical protein